MNGTQEILSLAEKTPREIFDEQYAKDYFSVKLSCGHKPTDPGDSIHSNGRAFVTGYAVEDKTKKKICFACATRQHRRDMRVTGETMAYLSNDGESVTTWAGGRLSDRVCVTNQTRGNFGDERVYFRFTFNGEVWSGMGRFGMYCKARRTKLKTIFD